MDLFIDVTSANLRTTYKSFKAKDYSMDEKDKLDKAQCEHGADCKKCGASGILKGLSSRMTSLMARAKQRAEAAVAHSTEPVVALPVQIVHEQRPFEPPVVPVVHITTPIPQGSIRAPDAMVSCGGCGHVYKSLGSCTRCDSREANSREAGPYYKR